MVAATRKTWMAGTSPAMTRKTNHFEAYPILNLL
jgi:hypothetical protein